MELRDLAPGDRDALAAMLRATPQFTDDEVAVALELIDDRLAGGTHYRFVVAADDVAGRRGVAGYACVGPAPMTDGIWDLYWIVVDPGRQGAGIGRALLHAAEQVAASSGGRAVLIETASQPAYQRTRAFYRQCGYTEVARIPDYYRDGDDKIIFRKILP